MTTPVPGRGSTPGDLRRKRRRRKMQIRRTRPRPGRVHRQDAPGESSPPLIMRSMWIATAWAARSKAHGPLGLADVVAALDLADDLVFTAGVNQPVAAGRALQEVHLVLVAVIAYDREQVRVVVVGQAA